METSFMDSFYLPEELVIPILESLPPTSALRFKSVCKSWGRVISAPGFLERSIRHWCKNGKTSLTITQVRGDEDEGFFIDPPYTVLESATPFLAMEYGLLRRQRDEDYYEWARYPVEAVGSCRGIVCFAEKTQGQCFLWNPTTGESRDLPNHDHYERSHYNFGIGSCDGDFKVVKISIMTWPFRHVRTRIYELSLDSWRDISLIGIDSDKIRSKDGCMTCWQDGRMCSWMAYWNYSDYFDDYDSENRTQKCHIVSFDMANETFTDFSSIFPVPYRCPNIYLRTLINLLALCFHHSSYNYGDKEENIDIWVFLQHGVVESWAKLWTIRLGPEPHWPLAFWNGGLVMTSRSDDNLRWCDVSNSPGIIQTLPVAYRGYPWRAISRVIAFEKTHASLDPRRAMAAVKGARYKKNAAKLNARKPFPEGASLRDGRSYASVLLSPGKKG